MTTTEEPRPGSYILAWEDEQPEHPIVAELRAQPGRWAIISMDVYQVVKFSHRHHPNLQYHSPLDGGPPKVRWLPDPIVAAMAVLQGGGYGDLGAVGRS